MESKEVVPSNVGRRRLSLSQNDVRAIFACVQNGGPFPDCFPFRIVVVPKFGATSGLKLSPLPYQYPDGVYVLLRPDVGIPPALADRVVRHHDLALMPDCPWGLSGPQYSGESVDLQQRYCTPKGKDDEYRSSTKGAVWTMVDSDGKEHYDCRVFVVYHGAPKRTAMSPKKTKRTRLSKKPSPQSRAPDPDIPKSSDNVDAPLLNGIGAEPSSSRPGKVKLPPEVASTRSSVLDAMPKGPPPKPPARKRSKKSGVRTGGNARQVTRTWRATEDVALAALVEEEPDLARIAWNVLATRMAGRSGKQCRERYINHLRPDRKKGRWTEEEDGHILRLQASLGNQWSKIAAALPGRSDNDVKNRWHSRMRSHKRKCEKATYDDPGTGDAEKENCAAAKQGRKRRWKATQKSFDAYWPDGIGSNVDLTTNEAPNIGQRVKVKLAGGKMHAGTITNASQKVGSTQEQRYSVMIHFDDGASLEAVLPNKDIRLDPTNNILSENEVMLCHELINLHDTLKNPDGAAQKKKDQSSAEESHKLSEHNISEDCQEGRGPLQRSGSDDSSETRANGSTAETEGIGTKNPANENEDEGGAKPSPQASALEARGNSDGAAATAGPLLAVASRSAVTEVPFLHPPNPTATNFPAYPAFQNRASAPFFAPPNQQQQLVAAAQLLSSVNPGLAVAAIAQASQLHSLGVRAQGPVFFPPLAPGGGFQQRPANFAMSPLGALQIPRRDVDRSSHALPEPSSTAEHQNRCGV